jgi:hypothetical protein
LRRRGCAHDRVALIGDNARALNAADRKRPARYLLMQII